MTTAFKTRADSSFGVLSVEGTEEKGERAVRRPMRGMLLQKETHAALSIDASYLKNSAVRGDSTYTTNFILQSITESRNEKVQYVSTFGSTYAFFFGEQPRIINCSAVLLNSPDFAWEVEWWENYEKVLRGTSLTSRNLRAYLDFDLRRVTGYLTNCTTTKNAQDPYLVNLNFSMFIESIKYDETPGATEVYASAGERSTRADYLGVGNVIDRDDLRTLSESTTAAVRRANIRISALNNTLSVAGLRGATGAVEGAVDEAIRRARNLLYGRNLVVPQSFIGQRISQPIFPEGTGAENLTVTETSTFTGTKVLTVSTNADPGSGSVILRANPDQRTESTYTVIPKSTFDNFDEYLNVPPRDKKVLDAIEEELATRKEDSSLPPSATAAFSAFGLSHLVEPYAAGADVEVDTAVALYQQRRDVSEKVRLLARTGFAVVSFGIAQSRVNARRSLQANITNPNNGGLDAATLAELQQQIAETTLTAEQERLKAEAEAEALRGNTGTVTTAEQVIRSTLSSIL